MWLLDVPFQTNLERVGKYDYEVLELEDKVGVITV